ncbi:hypothetical protein, partial [Vibrio tetraodonis]|uniref:hypothetical protein n=1 Tax=Vibrio tetraodonis TaxID=2231647 RepID=UPI001F26384B
AGYPAHRRRIDRGGRAAPRACDRVRARRHGRRVRKAGALWKRLDRSSQSPLGVLSLQRGRSSDRKANPRGRHCSHCV